MRIASYNVEMTIKGDSTMDDTSDLDAKIARLKARVSSLARKANARLRRLEQAELTDSPAYRYWKNTGGVNFGVRGKDYNQLQAELARLNGFLNAKTSTVRGAKSVLKDIASNTGMTGDYRQILANSSNFFRLAGMVEQYLNSAEGVANAINYREIWQAVNTYVQTSGDTLDGAEKDIESIIPLIAEIAQLEQEKRARLDIHNAFMDVFG